MSAPFKNQSMRKYRNGRFRLLSVLHKIEKTKTKTAFKINARKGKRKNCQDVCYFPNEIDEILRSF